MMLILRRQWNNKDRNKNFKLNTKTDKNIKGTE